MRDLLKTDDSWAGLILRVTLGVVMLPHGAQKLLGWFGGPGFNGTMAMFTDKMHIPMFLALLVIIAESFGSLALIAGLLTRLAAFGITCIMVVAIAVIVALPGPFPLWLKIEQGACGVLLLGVVMVVNGAHLRSVFATRAS